MNAGERPAEDRRNALYMRAQQNSAAARLTMHFGVAAGLTAVSKMASPPLGTLICHVSFMLRTLLMQKNIKNKETGKYW